MRALGLQQRTHRGFLAAAGGLLLAATGSQRPVVPTPASPPTPAPTGPTVRVTEPRASAERTRVYTLEARTSDLVIGSYRVTTSTYDGQLPGPELRVREGETLRVTLTNRLPAPTTIRSRPPTPWTASRR